MNFYRVTSIVNVIKGTITGVDMSEKYCSSSDNAKSTTHPASFTSCPWEHYSLVHSSEQSFAEHTTYRRCVESQEEPRRRKERETECEGGWCRGEDVQEHQGKGRVSRRDFKCQNGWLRAVEYC